MKKPCDECLNKERGSAFGISEWTLEKCQEWLASQCESNPCHKENCQYYATCRKVGFISDDTRRDCATYREWLGQIQGYAKGLQERGK